MINSPSVPKDFFISYNSTDESWAEWIAWLLEAIGYTVFFQAWDFQPGGNAVLYMQQGTESKQTIIVLSERYLNAIYTHSEWAAAFNQDPTSQGRKLIPIRVSPCKPTGLLAQLVYVDLVGKSETEAKQLILTALQDRAKPSLPPTFPKSTSVEDRVTQPRITFPGNLDLASSQSAQTPPSMAIPLSTPQPNQPLSSFERLKLIQTLNAFPSAQFEEVLIALNPPPGIVPDSSANQSKRTADLLRWIEGPTGRGLAELQAILSLYIGNPP